MISKFVETMKFNRRSAMVAVLLLLSVVLAACGGGGDGGGGSKQAATTAADPGVVVRMSNYSYIPREIRVKVGEEITFVNEDHLAHDVVQTTPDKVLFGDDRGFESPQVMPGSQWTTTFDKAGTYPILCTVEAHYLLGMTAEIIVE